MLHVGTRPLSIGASMAPSGCCPARLQVAHRFLANELSRHGFDISHYFLPRWYNDSIIADGVSVLPPLPSPSPTTAITTAAFLVGNTKRMWPIFLDWIEKERELAGKDKLLNNEPLDTYTMESIGKVVKENSWRFVGDDNGSRRSTGEPSYEIFWSSDTSENRLISMQRIASISGLCYLDKASNMAIHPKFGPWLSFRAAILFHVGVDIDTYREGHDSAQPVPMPVPNLLSKAEETNARKFVAKALEKKTSKEEDDDVVKCLIAARDSVVLGRDEHRFSYSQLMYHYTKDIKYLY